MSKDLRHDIRQDYNLKDKFEIFIKDYGKNESIIV
jgi:hypothetical protein